MRILRRLADRRRIAAVRRGWEALRAVLEPTLKASEWESDPTAADERRFFAAKTRVARLVPVLDAVTGPRDLEEEASAARRAMTELMNRTSTLSDVRGLDAEERLHIARDWHALHMGLARIEGAMTASGAGVGLGAAGAWVQERAEARSGGTGRRPWTGLFVFALEAAIVLGFVWAAASILGVGAGDVRAFLEGRPAPAVETAPEGAPAPAGPATADETGVGQAATPTGAAQATANQVEGAAVVQTPTGETEVTASAAPTSSARAGSRRVVAPARLRVPRLIEPVLSRYGAAAAFIVCGAVVSGLLLMFAVRSR